MELALGLADRVTCLHYGEVLTEGTSEEIRADAAGAGSLSWNGGPSMLEIRNLHSYYGEAYVLHGIDLTVPEAQVVALLGRNGMGKTTTIRSVMGLRPPTVRQGTVKLSRPSARRHAAPPDRAARALALYPRAAACFPRSPSPSISTFARAVRQLPAARLGRRQRVFQLFPRSANAAATAASSFPAASARCSPSVAL